MYKPLLGGEDFIFETPEQSPGFKNILSAHSGTDIISKMVAF